MNLDFSFLDSSGRLVLAGWDERKDDPHLVLEVDGTVVTPVVLSRFTRADLGDAPLGLLAAAVLPEGAEDIALIDPHGVRRVLDPEAIAGGDLSLIASALNETVEALLRALAAGEVGSMSPVAVARLLDRIRSTARQLPCDLPRIAVGIDRSVVGPGGLGFVTGWILTDSAASEPLMGLVCDGTVLVPLGIVAGSVPRSDLIGFRDRYRVGGRDGFVAAFRLPPAAERQAQLLLLPADPAFGAVVMTRPAEAISDRAAAQTMAEALSRMILPSDRAALLSALALQPGAGAFMLPSPTSTAKNGTVLLIVPDTEPAELRDVLRTILPGLARPVLVQPVCDSLAPEAGTALTAAAQEAGTGVTIGPAITVTTLSALSLPFGTEVVFGRASALFQLGLPPAVEGPTSGVAVALLHDPLAALAPGAATAQDLPASPFTLRLPDMLLLAALRAVPGGLLTPEGILAAAMQPVAAAGRLTVIRASDPCFWPGAAGGAAAAMLDAALQEAMP